MKKIMDKSPEILKLSASRVDTYDKCPRKYFFTYHEKLPRKPWDHFDLGTLVHGTLEFFHEHYRNDDSRPEKIRKHMKDCFAKQHDIMQKKKFVKPEIVEEARSLLKSYLKKIEEKGVGSTICAIEKKFSIPLGEVDAFDNKVSIGIQGFIDRVDQDADGIWHIKDYKTTKKLEYMKPFQLITYGIPLLKMNPDVEFFRGSFIMMRHDGKLVSYDFNREDVEKIKRELLEKAQRILTEQRWPPKPSPLCDWCDFKEKCLNSW